jgi:hypothetical protein
MQRLNTNVWKEFEHREEPSIIANTIAALDRINWDLSAVWDMKIFHFSAPNQRGKSKAGMEEEVEAGLYVVSTISFTQDNLKHNIFVSRFISKTVSG